MTGTKLTLSHNTKQIQQELNKLAKKAGNLKPALMEIGEELTNSTADRFDNEQSPDGTKWANLSQQTLKRKAKKNKRTKILQQDGDLKDLMRYQIKGNELEFGTDRVYGATHQFGDPNRNIPKREFLGISNQDEKVILDVLKKHINN